MKRFLIHALRCSALLIILTGCETTPTQQTNPDDNIAGPEAEVREPELTAVTVDLDAAANLLDQRQQLQAASILSDIDTDKLVADDLARYALIAARIEDAQGNAQAGLNSLGQALLREAEIHPELRRSLYRARISLLSSHTSTLQAAEYADGLLQTEVDPEYRDELSDWIWVALQQSSMNELDLATQIAVDEHWQQWLELALGATRVLDAPEQQAFLFENWRQQYPQHAAALSPPGGLELLGELAATRPAQVAVILPLSGRLGNAGNAVLEGYLATYYAALEQGWGTQDIRVLDSDLWSDINAAYTEAVSGGADLVIGPLTKSQLSRWYDLGAETPWLTLNRFENAPQLVDNIYQFGLAPEDEATRLADVAFAQGARKAMLIRPSGDWGDTMAAALRSRWQSLSGVIESEAVYSSPEDYSTGITAALELQESEQRATDLRRLIGSNFEFTPRRRSDIDSVFLLSARPDAARAIKPRLAFHYAGDLPVYSTSHIFSGRVDPRRDRDLNGITLVEMPWILNTDNPVRAAISDADGTDSLAAMYALGADAFLMHWRLPQLAHSTSTRVRGFTGLLSRDEAGRLHRELMPARMQSGVPVAADIP